MRIDQHELADAKLLSPDELRMLLRETLTLGSLWEVFGDPDFITADSEEEPDQ